MTEKLYWDNAYETKFTAKVISINEEGLVLDKTLFYPESGNQASDVGSLKIKEINFKVEKVTKNAENILHHISSDFKNIINIGDLIEGEIDWDYRYGVMKAHSSQHIFSAVIKNKYNIDTVRAILNFEDVFLQISQKLDYKQLKNILTEVNRICATNNLKVNSRIISRKEAEKTSEKIRSDIPSESQVRLIEIEDLDLVCCGGTHVKNTTEIGTIFIYEFKKGNEIRYVVGNKALEMSSNMDLDLIALANDVNSPVTKLKELLKKRLELIEDIQEQHKDLSIKLLESISKSPLKIINNISLFYIDFNVDIKLLNKSLDKFPSNSLIVVQFEGNKIRLLSPNEIIDSNKLLQKLIKIYGGKGGGSPKSSQGFLKKLPENLLSEIELLFDLIL
ncbi:MAG: alanyl-tRNA editing protein [Candidatus Lokiarchaeota archaeon]|nr:alanyl-tRNA editing protein [Candidatus Lokiarchaeota archaeon]